MYVMLEEKLLIFIYLFLMDPYESEDSLYTCKDFRWFSPNRIGRSKRWIDVLAVMATFIEQVSFCCKVGYLEDTSGR